MDAKQVNAEIAALVDRWCERRELGALASVLPAWLSNNGLTDGWEELARALRTMSHPIGSALPEAERDQLKRVYITIDKALRNR